MAIDPVGLGEVDGCFVLQSAHRGGDAQADRQAHQVQIALAVAAPGGQHDVVDQIGADPAERRFLVDVRHAPAELHQHLPRHEFARRVAQ
jgi:hypothetical protein